MVLIRRFFNVYLSKDLIEKYSLVIIGLCICIGFLTINHLVGLSPDASTYISVFVVLIFSLFAQTLINAHRENQARLQIYSQSLEEKSRTLAEANEKLFNEIVLRRETEKRLISSESKYRTIFEHTGTAMLICDDQCKVIMANSQLFKIAGYSIEELRSMDRWTSILLDVQENRILDWINEDRDPNKSYRDFEAIIRSKSGTEKNVYVTLASFQDSKAAMFSLVDITDLKQAEQKLYHQAFHDHLTGLPNRALFMELLSVSMRRARRSKDFFFSVLYLDIDRFKYINDSMGHIFGDQILVRFSEIIKACLRESDSIARMGGDEFAIILDDVHDPDYSAAVVKRINSALKKAMIIDGHEVFTEASIGMVTDCRDYENPDDIIRDADAAMYEAKESGRACFRVFEKKMHRRLKRVVEIETAMRKGLENDEFVLHYQPIVSLSGEHASNFEALIRWERPGKGLIPPVEFIPIAEETGLILPLGRWVLTKACEQMSLWQKEYPAMSGCSVSVNLSGRQFKDADLERHIAEVLRSTGLQAHNLRLEITESEVMQCPETAIELLGRISKLGIKIMLDDFGTGYSSLSYLHRFPIDYLKVDRDFVNRVDAASANSDRRIVETIISLAHGMSLEVVAEGVERESQVSFLSEYKCQFFQGDFFYSAMPPDQIREACLESSFSTKKELEQPENRTKETV
ncbi:MAG: EAL domain-containing protein [Desulfonatronovibrio sp. MSAO_Bac4]|nr:MAG: EAL domain-containing protein [Desulfonatronovibrio sp. MSAO_Bac4]